MAAVYKWTTYRSLVTHCSTVPTAMVKLVVVLALLGCALAEPPVNRGYLPPQQRNSAPSRFSTPSTQYGAPARQTAPSATYGAPTPSRKTTPARFSAPASTYGAPAPSPARFSAPASTYGAPAVVSARISTPANTYGAPSRRTAPARQTAPARFSAPAQQYGPPAPKASADSEFLTDSYSARATARAPAPVYGAPSARFNSAAEDPLAEPASYEFQYAVEDYESGANFAHQEDRQDESAKGEYRVLLPDGRTQIVEYTADEEGYQPSIRYEEAEGPYAASAEQRAQEGPY